MTYSLKDLLQSAYSSKLCQVSKCSSVFWTKLSWGKLLYLNYIHTHWQPQWCCDSLHWFLGVFKVTNKALQLRDSWESSGDGRAHACFQHILLQHMAHIPKMSVVTTTHCNLGKDTIPYFYIIFILIYYTILMYFQLLLNAHSLWVPNNQEDIFTNFANIITFNHSRNPLGLLK